MGPVMEAMGWEGLDIMCPGDGGGGPSLRTMTGPGDMRDRLNRERKGLGLELELGRDIDMKGAKKFLGWAWGCCGMGAPRVGLGGWELMMRGVGSPLVIWKGG